MLARYEYSEQGELLAAFDALGKALRFEYEDRRLIRHTNRNGLSFYYEYDGARQSARCVKAWGDGGLYAYTFTFDPVLKRVTTTNSLGATSTAQLGELGLPIWEIDPLGGITQYEYDERGRTIAVTDRDGNGNRYRYDESGNLLVLARADGSTIAMTFDEEGRPLSSPIRVARSGRRSGMRAGFSWSASRRSETRCVTSTTRAGSSWRSRTPTARARRWASTRRAT